MAGKNLVKKCLKLVQKAAKAKTIRRGVKESVKAIRKGEQGLMIIAGNISPIDVITHIPVLCEEAGISYVYLPSKEELGSAGATKRPTSCILISNKSISAFEEEFNEVVKEVVAMTPSQE